MAPNRTTCPTSATKKQVGSVKGKPCVSIRAPLANASSGMQNQLTQVITLTEKRRNPDKSHYECNAANRSL